MILWLGRRRSRPKPKPKLKSEPKYEAKTVVVSLDDIVAPQKEVGSGRGSGGGGREKFEGCSV